VIQIAIIAIISSIIGGAFGFQCGVYSYIAMTISLTAFYIYRLNKRISESKYEK
jgi:hypothetical protein